MKYIQITSNRYYCSLSIIGDTYAHIGECNTIVEFKQLTQKYIEGSYGTVSMSVNIPDNIC